MSELKVKPTPSDETSGKVLVNSLALLLRTAQIHHINNVAVTNAIHKFLALINQLISSMGKVTLQLIGEFFYLNDSRVRYSVEYIFNFDFLIREFKKRKLGTIIFKDPLDEHTVMVLVNAFITSGPSEEPFQTLSKILANVRKIDVMELKKVKDDYTEPEIKKLIKKTYSDAVLLTRGVVHRIKAGERINLKNAKRVISTVVDHVIENESMLLGITTLKDYDEYTYYHAVNVSILSVALGHRLGLSRRGLSMLGLAALFHDIGKVKIPIDVLNKPTEFTEDEWKMVREHPVQGALIILKLKHIDDSAINISIPAFEHHLNYALSGYPKIKSKIDLDLFSKIITIADQYDAMTSARVYLRTPQSPEAALSTMIEKSGKHLDPSLLKVFINMIGIYPIGSLVMLNTKELGLVFENNSNPDFINRPRVLIITDSSGERVENTVVDLMDRDKDDNYKRSIIKTLDPNKYGINLAEYLL